MSGALVVAIISLCVAVASLTWNVVNYLLSGSRIKVDFGFGISGPSGVAWVEAAKWQGPPEWMSRQVLGAPCVVVIVRNVGRAAITADRCDVVFATGNRFGMARPPEWEVQTPHRLEPGSSVNWSIELASVEAIAEMNGFPEKAWVEVALGTGRSVRSRRKHVFRHRSVS